MPYADSGELLAPYTDSGELLAPYAGKTNLIIAYGIHHIIIKKSQIPKSSSVSMIPCINDFNFGIQHFKISKRKSIIRSAPGLTNPSYRFHKYTVPKVIDFL